nr:apolipoprotein A-IV-like [Misgurnus anguillicaudatus]
MKTIVILSLAVFTGCQISCINAKKPNPHLEHLKDLFWSYIAQATHTTDKTAEKINEPQLGQDVSTSPTQDSDQYITIIKNHMDVVAKEWMSNVAKEAEVLKELLEQDLMTLKDQLESYADNIKSQIQQRVEELGAAMTPYADSLHSETLNDTLLQTSEELKSKA